MIGNSETVKSKLETGSSNEREFQEIVEFNCISNCARHCRTVWRDEDFGSADPCGLAGMVRHWSDTAQWPELTRGAKIDVCH
jgi:hypothetical protein